MFCDIVDLDGSPFQGDPRHVLRRALDRAHDLGFTFYAAPEIEFFYFADADPSHAPVTLDTGSYFELTVADRASDIRQRTVLTLEEMGIPVEHAQHEDAPSQHEIDLRYTDALTMADTVMTVRLVVKEMARQQGVFASFMPKPLAGVQGSGMHTHMSLFRGDTNAFVDLERPGGLSEVAEGFIAGLLRHAPEITAVTNQWVNSYKRLVSGYEAPIHVSWARNNRSALVRVPVVKPGKTDSTRIEYRSPDSACNPYLAFAVILAAGLEGIEQGYELPPEADANLFDLSADELAAKDILHLPGSLNEALGLMESSELVADHPRRPRVRVVHPQQAGRVGRLQVARHPVRARPVPPAAVTGSPNPAHSPTEKGGTPPMEPLLCFPATPPTAVTAVLDRAGYPWLGIDKPEEAESDEPEDGWSGAVICSGSDPTGAFLLCRHLRKREVPLAPVIVVVPTEQLAELELREDLFDDLCLEPVNADELSARLAHLFWRTGRGLRPDLLEHGPLVLNLETYQAAVAGRVLDLTYMEYELLRFLAARPGKVFTRETLLSRVWGYEYYGGARTVDVHVRRLRAKLGEEHAHLIQTVRSVGYRFGQTSWTP